MNNDAPGRILEGVQSAPNFEAAADRLTDWAVEVTGCQAAMLRFREVDPENDSDGDSQREPWIPVLVERGFGCSFLRDEVLIADEECLCGRVCRGCLDDRFPFFTPSGSFSWGAVQRMAMDYPVQSLGNVRGRCIAEGFESLLIVPLLGPDASPIGCLHLADTRPDKFVDHVELLEAVGRLAGPMLLRFSLEDRQASVIKAVETALAPPILHRVSGLDVAVSYSSATETAHLGGDFYDVIELDGGGVILVVGDYSGRGIAAAGMAARARHAIATTARSVHTPGLLLALAEEALRGRLPQHRFVTAVVCRYSPGGGLESAVAGHPPPLLLDAGGGVREIALPPSPPLGYLDGIEPRTTSARLAAAQTLLLYTDGITESRQGSSFFGIEGIAAFWRTNPGREPADLTAGLCKLSADFHQKGLAPDDRLALAAGVLGT